MWQTKKAKLQEAAEADEGLMQIKYDDIFNETPIDWAHRVGGVTKWPSKELRNDDDDA